jgi:hypothetical protein
MEYQWQEWNYYSGNWNFLYFSIKVAGLVTDLENKSGQSYR